MTGNRARTGLSRQPVVRVRRAGRIRPRLWTNVVWAVPFLVGAAVAGGLGHSGGATANGTPESGPTGDRSRITYVTDFLPKGHVTDGSVSYQAEIQTAVDAGAGHTVVFSPMVYRLDEARVTVRGHQTLQMYGAVFRFDEHRTRDGQAFAGRNVVAVRFLGGEIAGHNDIWPDGVNIRGIYVTGRSQDIRIQDMHIHGLSSNGIGVFGNPTDPARDVWVTDTVVEDCCNFYGDFVIADNVLYTTNSQVAAIRIDTDTATGIVVKDNLLRGENRHILVEGSRQHEVTVHDNDSG